MVQDRRTAHKARGASRWAALIGAVLTAGCANDPAFWDDDRSPIEEARVDAQRDASLEELEDTREALAAQRRLESQRLEELDDTISAINAQIQSVAEAQEALAEQMTEIQQRLDGLDGVRDRLTDSEEQLKSLDAARSSGDAARRQLQTELNRLSRAVEDLRKQLQARQAEREDQARRDQALEQEAAQLLEGLAPEGADAFGVHLVTIRDRAVAEQTWRSLRRDHDDLLRALSPRLELVRVGDLGSEFYRLIAGPFQGADAAAQFCRRAESRNLFCEVRGFKGEPLGA